MIALVSFLHMFQSRVIEMFTQSVLFGTRDCSHLNGKLNYILYILAVQYTKYTRDFVSRRFCSLLKIIRSTMVSNIIILMGWSVK